MANGQVTLDIVREFFAITQPATIHPGPWVSSQGPRGTWQTSLSTRQLLPYLQPVRFSASHYSRVRDHACFT